MQLWDNIKRYFQRRAEEYEQAEVFSFMIESEYEPPVSLKKRDDRLVHKRHLTLTYAYQEGDDLLAKKQDFIDQYTVNEKEQLDFFVGDQEERNDVARCKAWRDHEQVERFSAQQDWRKVVYRNHRRHMFQKFMNQKTR